MSKPRFTIAQVAFLGATLLGLVAATTHLCITFLQAQRIDSVSRHLLTNNIETSVTLEMRGGLLFPRPLAKGVRLIRKSDTVDVRLLDSDSPALQFKHIAFQALPLVIYSWLLFGCSLSNVRSDSIVRAITIVFSMALCLLLGLYYIF